MDAVVPILLIVCAAILAIGAFWFWIQMLIQAANLHSPSARVAWVIIVVMTGFIGAVVFRFGGPYHDKEGPDGLTDEDREMLRAMRAEFENGPGSRPKVVLTPDEERMLAEYRRAYRGDP
jgi:hypothetical protein